MAKQFMSQAVSTAAYRFLEALGERPFPAPAIDCAKAAFALYNQEWDCHAHHITSWEWPATVARSGESFQGDEPWTVLLRRTAELVRNRRFDSQQNKEVTP